MNYAYLIIITNEKIKLDNKLDVLYFNSSFSLIDDCHLQINNEIFEFEYLIYSSKVAVNYTAENYLMMENNIPITNFYYQTSKENIYYITEENLKEKIEEIINSE